jgi:hypothetical protein
MKADYQQARNPDAWAVGQWRKGRFAVRRVLWGRMVARAERRPNERIERALILIRKQPA